MVKSKIVIFILFLLVTLQSSYGASFDCKKASTMIEKAICNDPVLSNMDELLATAYKKALKNDSDKNKVRRSQRSWIKSQRNQCKNIPCLKKVYTSRISELDDTVDYTAARFFIDIDREYIATIDEISENQKNAIVKSGFLVGSEVCDHSPHRSIAQDYVLWYVIGIDNHSLKLGRCDSAQKLNIKVYRKKSGGYLIAIESVMDGSGPKSSFSFFPVSKDRKIGSVLTPDKIGLQVHENEFLSADKHLSEGNNTKTHLYMNKDGNIESFPWTLMNPLWEHQERIYRIWFEWNGENFIKRVEKVDN